MKYLIFILCFAGFAFAQDVVETLEQKKAKSLPIVSAALQGVVVGGLDTTGLTPAKINDVINEAKVIKLEEKKITIPERKEAREVYDSLGAYIRTDSVTIPAQDIAQIPTRDMWLDSMVQAGDVITVAVQHERDGALIGNQAYRIEPTLAEVAGKIRVKVMNVR